MSEQWELEYEMLISFYVGTLGMSEAEAVQAVFNQMIGV